MTRNSRELSQFASFIDIKDANQNIGVITSMVFNPGGIGIGSDVSDYLSEAASRGAIDPLINWNKSFFLDDVLIDGSITVEGEGIAITGTGATFPALNVNGLTTTRDLLVTGVTTLSRDTGMGTVYIGEPNITVANAGGSSGGTGPSTDGGIQFGPGGGNFLSDDNTANALVLIDSNYPNGADNQLALQVFGRAQFNGEVGQSTSFVVVPDSLFYGKPTFVTGVEIRRDNIEEFTPDGTLRVYSPFQGGRWDIPDDEGDATPAVDIDGGINITQYAKVGASLSVNQKLEVGQYLESGRYAPGDPNGFIYQTKIFNEVELRGPSVSIGVTDGDSLVNDLGEQGNVTQITLNYSQFNDAPVPNPTTTVAIGTELNRWDNVYAKNLSISDIDSLASVVNLDVSAGATIGKADISGVGATNSNEIYFTVGPGKSLLSDLDTAGYFNHLGIATINGSLNVISDGVNNAYVTTAFQAENVNLTKQDVNNSTNPEFFYPAMANAGISQTAVGGELFVNPGFYLDAFGTSLFVHNNLSVLGTAINASLENPDLRFDLLNYGVTELNLASQAKYIDIGEPESADGGITSIRSEVTELVRLRLKQNDIQASTGATAITLNEDINVNIAGWVQIGGTYIKCDQNDINIADTSLRADLFKSATDVVIGGNDLGIATIRNNITDLTGFLKLGKNVIQADDGATAIEVGTSGTFTSIIGDVIVGGNDIQTGFGITNITMVGDSKTILYGDLEIRGNEILSSDGNINILMFDGQELTSFTGAIRVEGDQIRAGTGDTNIYMIGDQLTRIAGRLQVDGNEVQASNGQINFSMDSDLLTDFKGDIRVGGGGTIAANDGTICITIEGGTGNVAIGSDVTANSAFFNGLEARLNVQDVDIRDNLLTIGLIEDPTNEGTLIPPNVSIGNSGDVGLVMARYDVGLSTHKYAAIYYDNSAGRVAIRTDVEDAGLGVGRDRYLLANGLPSELEVQNLYVNYNTTLGIKTIFEAGNIDTGEEVIDVLNVVNVEIDAGTF